MEQRDARRIRNEPLSRSERWTLIHRTDLLASECEIKMESGVNWFGRLCAMPEHTSGGSTLDRKLIVQAMAKIEQGLIT